MAERQLMEYFGFDEADLAANRQGQLSPGQWQSLERDQGSMRRWSGVLGGVLTLIVLGLAAWIIRAYLATHELAFDSVLWMIIAALTAYYFLRRWRSAGYDYAVQKAEGPVSFRSERTSQGGTVYHALHVGGQEFDVDAELEDAMAKGDVYAVYYVKNSSNNLFVMSVDLISKSISGQTGM